MKDYVSFFFFGARNYKNSWVAWNFLWRTWYSRPLRRRIHLRWEESWCEWLARFSVGGKKDTYSIIQLISFLTFAEMFFDAFLSKRLVQQNFAWRGSSGMSNISLNSPGHLVKKVLRVEVPIDRYPNVSVSRKDSGSCRSTSQICSWWPSIWNT